MRFSFRFCASEGRVIPCRTVANQPAKIGDLRVEETRDEDLRRYIRTVKLFSDYSTALAEPYDVRLICMSQQAFTLAGFERVDGVDYAQSWLVAPA